MITHKYLTERAKKHAPNAYHISLSNFLDNSVYDNLVSELKASKSSSVEPMQTKEKVMMNKSESLFSLSQNNVFLGLSAKNKEDAIKFVGQN